MPSGSLANRDFRVGESLVQPRLARIKRDGGTLHITPRAMAVLVYLAEANGAVVSRNAILDAVWPRMAVTPDALSQCLVELRRAFGDDSKHPRTIETIPRIGVRLIPRVRLEDYEPKPEAPASPVAAPAPPLAMPAPGAVEARPEEAIAEAKARRSPRSYAIAAACAAVIVVAAVSLWPVERVEPELSAEAAQNRRALALLPLAYDVTADDNVRVFAEAVHDELLSRLAQIRALDKVVSRTAVSGYRDTSKPARVIGRELGVGSLLEGRVHAVGDAVRLSVQLIDAPTNGVVWGDTYTVHMTAEDFFAVQSRLAIAIAEALEATLSATELARLREVPTTNTRAHDFYLSGNDYARRLNEPQKILPLLVQQYSRATEEDPRFALAWARLGMAHAAVYWYGMDRTPERVQRADSAIRTALALAPELPEAHVAKADFLWRVRGDYQGALAEISVAERDIPQEPNLQFLRASLYMRRGEWDLAIAGLDKALEFDPRNVVYLRQQSTSYMLKRDHAGVERNLARILEIAPDDGTAYVDRAHLGLYAHGDTTLANRYEGSPPAPSYATALAATYVRWLAAIFDRDYVRALSILDGSSEEPVFDGDLRNSFVPKALLYARTHLLAGNADEALRELRLAKSAIERQLASLEASQWAPLYIALAEVCAALGDKAGAVAALANSPRVVDAAQGSGLQLAAAIRVYLPLGDYDRALRELDAYLSSPGRWTIEGLSADPRLDPLRSDPRFVALVAKHARG